MANKYEKYLLNKEFDELFKNAFDSDTEFDRAIWKVFANHIKLLYRAYETGCIGEKEFYEAMDILHRIEECTDEARILYVPVYNRTLEKVEKKLGDWP